MTPQEKEKLVALTLREAIGGSDILDITLAQNLRTIQIKYPDLIEITSVGHEYADADELPFFGAIATEEGERFCKRILGDCELTCWICKTVNMPEKKMIDERWLFADQDMGNAATPEIWHKVSTLTKSPFIHI